MALIAAGKLPASLTLRKIRARMNPSSELARVFERAVTLEEQRDRISDPDAHPVHETPRKKQPQGAGS